MNGASGSIRLLRWICDIRHVYSSTTNSNIVIEHILRKKLDKLTIMFTVRIAKGHGTVSFVSSVLIAGTFPLDLRVKKAAKLYTAKRTSRSSTRKAN